MKLFIKILQTGILAIIIGTGVSCETKSDIPMPDKLLSKEQMISVMADIHLAEAAISLSNINHQTAVTRFKKYECDIFEKHHIDSVIYHQNYNYYVQQPKQMEKMYKALTDTLTIRKTGKLPIQQENETKL